MKKGIIFIYCALALSGVVKAQSEELELNKAIQTDMDDLSNWARTTKTFKTGDNDKSQTIGLLKNIFSDTTVKDQYAKINPRIADLSVNSPKEGLETNFKIWIKSINYLDSTKFNLQYELYDGTYAHETLRVFDIQQSKYVRVITIYYNEENLRSIFDSKF